jgi:hypothetical protein
MPTEYRFDDLDLREESARTKGESDPSYTLQSQPEYCPWTKNCTINCCVSGTCNG